MLTYICVIRIVYSLSYSLTCVSQLLVSAESLVNSWIKFFTIILSCYLQYSFIALYVHKQYVEVKVQIVNRKQSSLYNMLYQVQGFRLTQLCLNSCLVFYFNNRCMFRKYFRLKMVIRPKHVAVIEIKY
jgi:hypothetical protein